LLSYIRTKLSIMDHDLDRRANVSSVCYYWFAPPFGGGETEHAPRFAGGEPRPQRHGGGEHMR
jgi:hypothetical protein